MVKEEHNVTSASGEYTRNISLLHEEGADAKQLFVFLDAEFYLDRMDGVSILTELRDGNQIPPFVYAFVSHVDTEKRMYDYVCSETYATFIADDVFQWLTGYFPDLSTSGNVLAGLSLSGLQTAYTVSTRRDRFSYALCQSGSFWWNDEWLTDQVHDLQGSRFYISVGDKETECLLTHEPAGIEQKVCQLDATKRYVEALGRQGAETTYRIFNGGHAIEPWRAELPGAIQWLVGNELRPRRDRFRI